MTDQTDQNTYNALFICTANSARSILAEAAMNTMSKGRFRVYSVGAHPSGHCPSDDDQRT